MDKDILERIEQAKETKELYLEDVSIDDEVWNKIAKLSNLEVLGLTEIVCENIPTKLSVLKSIKKVYFHKIWNAEILSFLSNLPKIETLSISNTGIKDFSLIKNLVTLKRLEISSYSTKINDFSFLKKLTNLTYLELNDCGLNEIPKEIFELKNLEVLNLGLNSISKISDRLTELKNIRILDLYNNNISEIPLEIVNLPKLNFENLNVESNPLDMLQFGYMLPNQNWGEEVFKLFDEQKGNVLKNNNFICVENGDNHYFVNFVLNDEGFFLSPNPKEPAELKIFVFGNPKKRLKVLNNARKVIEEWIEENDMNYTFFSTSTSYEDQYQFYCTRFFYYQPNPLEKRYTVFIDYEKLLEHKFLEKNIFSGDNERSFIEVPVEDLIKYIGAENERPSTEWNGSSSITKIEIKDFKGFSKIECDLEKHINILIGRNGLGKTSFLQALTLALLPISNIDKSNEFENYISIGKTKSDILLHWEKEYRKVYVFRNELRHERYLDIPQKWVLAYGTNLQTKKDLGYTKIVEQLINGDALPYATKSIFSESFAGFFDPAVLLEELFREKKDRENKLIDNIIYLIKNTLDVYLDLFSESEKIIKLEGQATNYYYLDFSNNKLKIENLSEGYKDFILQITDIIVRIIAARNTIFEDQKIEISNQLFEEAKGVIIIDEFDRHLHPNLQRRFLSQLEADFKNIQFVLSTHNILSLQSGEGHTALILNTDNGFLNIKTEPIQKGLSIESIYNEYFGGENEVYSYETGELLKQFKELLKKQQKKKLTDAENKTFKKITKELVGLNERIEGIVTREIRQFERLTGKSVELWTK